MLDFGHSPYRDERRAAARTGSPAPSSRAHYWRPRVPRPARRPRLRRPGAQPAAQQARAAHLHARDRHAAAPPRHARPRRHPRTRRDPDRRRRQGHRRRGQHHPRHPAAAAAPAPRDPGAAGAARGRPPARLAADRRGPQRAHAVGRQDARRRPLRRTRGRLRLAVLRADPRRGHPLRRALAAAVDLDLPHARDGGRPLARRAGDGGLLRPHLHRPGRAGTTALLTRRHRQAPHPPRDQPLGRRRRPARRVPRPHAPDGGAPRRGRSPPTTPTPSASAAATTPDRSPTRSLDSRRSTRAADRRAPAAAQRHGRSAATAAQRATDPRRRHAQRLQLPLDDAEPADARDELEASACSRPRATSTRTATTAPRSQHDRRDRIVPCALQPRDVAIVRDVWRYKFLTAPQLLELWWPGRIRPRRPAPPAQALPRRLPRALPAASPAAAPSPGPTTSAHDGHRLLQHAGLIPARQRFTATHDLRLRPRPARAPAQRLGARLPPRARRRAPRLGRRDRHRPAARGRAAGSCASTTTGPPKASATRAHGCCDPTPSSRSTRDDGDGTRTTVLIEYDRTRRVDKNYDKFRRYDAFLNWWWRHTPLADRRRPAVRALRLPRRTTSASSSWPPPTTSSPATAGTPACDADRHEYVGRGRMLFALERDAHAGALEAWRLPAFPPDHPSRTPEVRRVRLPGGAARRSSATAHHTRRGRAG